MLPGEVIADRFELVQLAQAGGMGAVYRARDRVGGGDVAIKVMRAPAGGHDARFLREAALVAELHHPAIVRHVAHGRTAQGELYLAMEWLDGEDLARRLARGPLPAAEAIALVRRVADGLAILHARGGLHRDLKPANLFLEGGRPDRVKILDFGIARAAASAVTQVGSIVGTPGYTAPEQARGSRDLDARADVFALGCVLFECLTGRAAFRGDHVMAVLARILLEDPPRLVDLAPEAPPALEALVARLLHKDPGRRPRDGAELRDLLDVIAAGAPRLELTGPLTPRPPSLGSDEQRFMCLVACALPAADAAVVGSAPTLAPAPAATPATGAGAAVEPTLVPDEPANPERLAALVRSHGARLERLADGSWVALPDRGAHAAATDQAAQAARVALALARALPLARVAIAAGRGLQAGRAPVGEVIDRALALLGVPGAGVAVDGLTAGLLGGRFELLDDAGTLRLIGEPADGERERRVLGRVTPCIGRDRELATLIGLFEECVTEPCARAVLIRGPAGYGKSRVRAELHARLRARGAAFEWLYGRGDPLHVGAPFAIAAQVVRRAAGIVEGEPTEQRRARLAARVAAVVAPEDRGRVGAFLGELAHVPAEAGTAAVEAARRDVVVMGDQLRRAWEDWLAAECDRRPVILVLEDLHLGDLASVKLIDSALRNLRERPLLALALARPELDLLFPGMWGDRGVVAIPLPELSRRAAGRLVREILGDEAPDATVDRIVAQAGGNAFYLEELCRVVHGGGAAELPGTVLAMAQARLEALDPESRRLLRAGAVFGGRFPRGGALALWGDPEAGGAVDRLLEGLVERELLEPAPPEFRDEPTFAFRHALVREAAYAMLTDSDRRLGHQLAADWLVAAGAADPVLIAEHHERGGRPELAIAGFLAAARDALEGNDLAAVLARVERGLGCGARGEQLGELLLLRAEAHRWRADYTAASEAGALALAALPPGSTAWCQAATAAMAALMSFVAHDRLDEVLTRTVHAPPLDPIERLRAIAKGTVQLYLMGRYERADELLAYVDGELARMAPAQRDEPLLQGRICEARAFRDGARADQGRALALLEAAAAAYARAGDLRNACMCQNNVGYTYVQLGAYGRAAEALAQALRDADRMALPYVSTVLTQNLAVALAHLGQLDRSIELQRAAIEAFRRQPDHHMLSASRAYLAQALVLAGDLDGAEREAAAALEPGSGSAPSRAYALANLARVRTRRGDAAGALAPAREAYAILESLGGLDEGEMLVRVAHAEALAAAGRADEARAVCVVARARLDELTSKLPPELRPEWLERVPEHAALLALGRACAPGAGSPDGP